ncbi:MAG: aminoglycoside phosphotransferase [Acidobacteriota bacterium]|nr:aminoglycoside phosphotransferase [Acidobacteriota bacterium]
MIKLRSARLPAVATAQLKTWQTEIVGTGEYPAWVAAAKSKFSQRNRADNATFKEVREALTRACSGARRCNYCEDSVADEVEHIQPKDLYPEVVFAWDNYLYACGPCNGPKNSQFAVFLPTGELKEVTRKHNDPVVAPIKGDPVLINPRREDATEWMMLDLRVTFLFVPIAAAGSKEFQRAKYTIELLRLNERDYLIEARQEAYESYRARLNEYIFERDSGASKTQLNRLVKALQRMQHPTVWIEMKRQQQKIPELKALFTKAPEALNW